MKTPLPLLVALCFVLVPCGVQADGAYQLAWDECVPKGGLGAIAFSCNSNEGTTTLVCSFSVNSALSVEAITIDMSFSTTLPCDGPGPCRGPDMPSWWQLQSGGCRDGSFSLSTDFTAPPFSEGSGCTDPWGHSLPIHAPVQVTYPVYDSYWGWYYDRVRLHTVINPYPALSLAAGVEYYAFQIIVDHTRTVGEGACAGCCDFMVALINNLTLSSGGQDYYLSGAYGRYTAWWQSDGGSPPGECGPTPTVAKTWGRLKSMYR